MTWAFLFGAASAACGLNVSGKNYGWATYFGLFSLYCLANAVAV